MPETSATRRRALRAVAGVALGVTAGCSTVLRGDGDGGPAGTATAPGGGTDVDGGTSTPTREDGEDRPLALRPVATGFRAPLDLADPPGTERRYVVDQPGVVSSVDADGGVEPALDLRDSVVTDRREQGMLGIALHPRFEENRRLYLRYSAHRRPGTPSSFRHTFVLSEFVATESGGAIDPDSERTLMEIPEPQWNHNAGSILFGPDGYLYVGVGDGGGRGDVGEGHADDWYRENRGGNGQDVTDNLLGSILRIDVDVDAEAGGDGRPYGVPDDNPLVGEVGLDEHWAWGFRNPWRMSFDGEDLYVGDVGQSAYEEVDLVRRGGNYGWNVKEGTHCYGASSCPDETPDGDPLIDPIIEYPHGDEPVSGSSVIGGYVYRGDDLPGLAGSYVFGDLATDGRLFAATGLDDTGGNDGGLWPVRVVPLVGDDRGKLERLLSFGRDRDGRLYALGRGEDGGVYELRPGG